MMRRPIFAIAMLSVLAGCSAVVVQDAPPPRGFYQEREFDLATLKGAIVTLVLGNPFGEPKAEFDALVRKLMYGQNREQKAEFVASPGERTTPPYKVVVGFNVDRAVSPNTMCANPQGVATRPEEKRLRIDIAFCYGDRAKSDTSGYVDGVTGTSDPKFAELIRRATYTMLPDENLMNRERDSENFPK